MPVLRWRDGSHCGESWVALVKQSLRVLKLVHAILDLFKVAKFSAGLHMHMNNWSYLLQHNCRGLHVHMSSLSYLQQPKCRGCWTFKWGFPSCLHDKSPAYLSPKCTCRVANYPALVQKLLCVKMLCSYVVLLKIYGKIEMFYFTIGLSKSETVAFYCWSMFLSVLPYIPKTQKCQSKWLTLQRWNWWKRRREWF